MVRSNEIITLSGVLVIANTANAVLIREDPEAYNNVGAWLPRSQIEIEDDAKGAITDVNVPMWLAAKHGLGEGL